MPNLTKSRKHHIKIGERLDKSKPKSRGFETKLGVNTSYRLVNRGHGVFCRPRG